MRFSHVNTHTHSEKESYSWIVLLVCARRIEAKLKLHNETEMPQREPFQTEMLNIISNDVSPENRRYTNQKQQDSKITTEKNHPHRIYQPSLMKKLLLLPLSAQPYRLHNAGWKFVFQLLFTSHYVKPPFLLSLEKVRVTVCWKWLWERNTKVLQTNFRTGTKACHRV